jgi:hypothetical protein
VTSARREEKKPCSSTTKETEHVRVGANLENVAASWLEDYRIVSLKVKVKRSLVTRKGERGRP